MTDKIYSVFHALVNWFVIFFSVISKNIRQNTLFSISFCSGFQSFSNHILRILKCPLWSSWHMFCCEVFLPMQKLGPEEITQSPPKSHNQFVAKPRNQLPSFPLFSPDVEDWCWWGSWCQAPVWLIFNDLYFYHTREVTSPFLARSPSEKVTNQPPESCLQNWAKMNSAELTKTDNLSPTSLAIAKK